MKLFGLCFFHPHTRVQTPVPLKSISVDAVLVDSVGQVVVSQTYVNNESFPIEAVFKFPIDEQGAVCGFSAVVDGVEIRGVVKEKEEAFRDYDRAIARGDGAFLGEADKADIFSISVGNLPAHKVVTVRVTYLTRLAAEGQDLRFVLPLAVCPRYTPSAGSMAPTDSAVSVTTSASAAAHYPLSFGLALCMTSEVLSVTSPSHSLAQNPIDKARFTLDGFPAAMDRDLVVLVRTARPCEPQVCAEIDAETGHGAAMVSLFPLFENITVPTELIFVVDRSGSMAGQKMESTKAALQLFLRSMPAGSKFNIVSFGSGSSALFPSGAQDYSQHTMSSASAHVAAMSADMGGTEILSALETRVFATPLFPEHARQVFLLTDGEVSNNDAVIAAVRKVAATTRVFAFGIGNGASRALVNGVARAGRGVAEFIADGEAIVPKIMRQLKRAVQPSLRDVRVEWLAQGAPVPGADAAPSVAPPVFNGDRFLSFAFFEPGAVFPDEVSISGTSPTGRVESVLKVPFATARRGNIVHRMAAKELIRELEEGGPGAPQVLPRSGSKQTRNLSSAGASQGGMGGGLWGALDAEGAPLSPAQIKARVVALGVKYSLASLHTSFVAVEYRDNKVSSQFMQLRNVPAPEPAAQPRSRGLLLGSSGGARGGRMGQGMARAPMMFSSSSLAAPAKCMSMASSVSSMSCSDSFGGSGYGAAPSAPVFLEKSMKEAEGRSRMKKSESSSVERRGGSRQQIEQQMQMQGQMQMQHMQQQQQMQMQMQQMQQMQQQQQQQQQQQMQMQRVECFEALSDIAFFDHITAIPAAAPVSGDPFAAFSFGDSAPAAAFAAPPAPTGPRGSVMMSPAYTTISSAAPTSSPRTRPSRPDDLVILQEFDGTWQATDSLALAMGLSLSSLQSLLSTIRSTVDTSSTSNKNKIINDMSITTALVFAWLARWYSGHKEEWEMLAEKAKVWLEGRGEIDLVFKAAQAVAAM